MQKFLPYNKTSVARQPPYKCDLFPANFFSVTEMGSQFKRLPTRISAVMQEKTLVNLIHISSKSYEGWNFNSGNYLFTIDTK